MENAYQDSGSHKVFTHQMFVELGHSFDKCTEVRWSCVLQSVSGNRWILLALWNANMYSLFIEKLSSVQIKATYIILHVACIHVINTVYASYLKWSLDKTYFCVDYIMRIFKTSIFQILISWPIISRISRRFVQNRVDINARIIFLKATARMMSNNHDMGSRYHFCWSYTYIRISAYLLGTILHFFISNIDFGHHQRRFHPVLGCIHLYERNIVLKSQIWSPNDAFYTVLDELTCNFLIC